MKGQKKNTETAMHMNSFLPWKVDERVAKLVKTTCFKNFLELGDGHHKPNHKLNLSLLTVVMSFFDTKKMAFSFRKNCIVDFGLEDILYITGLPIDGEQVSGEESSDNVGIIKTYLKISEEKAKGLSKRTLGISPALLKSQFENVPENLEGEDLEPYFMAYLLFLLGTLVVPNKTKDISPMYLPLLQKDKVNNYAWGAAMLAILKDSLFEWKESYTNDGTTTSLCGFALALQVFALERFPISQQQSPSKFPLMVEWEKVYKPYTKGCSVETVEQYEKMFLNMKKDEIKWQPYSKIELPKEYTSQLRMVFANVPCICFNIISYNYPGTFFTQLGLEKSDLTGEKLWGKKIKGTPKQRSKHKDKNWRVCTKFYEEVNRRWESRYDHLVYQRHIEETKMNFDYDYDSTDLAETSNKNQMNYDYVSPPSEETINYDGVYSPPLPETSNSDQKRARLAEEERARLAEEEHARLAEEERARLDEGKRAQKVKRKRVQTINIDEVRNHCGYNLRSASKLEMPHYLDDYTGLHKKKKGKEKPRRGEPERVDLEILTTKEEGNTREEENKKKKRGRPKNSEKAKTALNAIYDPFLEVEKDKLLCLIEYIRLKNDAQDVKLYEKIITPRNKWPHDDYGWLSSEHITWTLRMFHRRSARDPTPFCSSRIAFLCPYIASMFVYTHKKFKLRNFTWDDKYVKLFNGVYGDQATKKRWFFDIGRLFVCHHVNKNHWVALDINLEESKIDIYDSIPSLMGDKEIVASCLPFSEIIPALLNYMIPTKNRERWEQFKVQRMRDIPQNDSPGDCGVYSLKYIECLALGRNFDGLCDANIQKIREKLAAELFDEIAEAGLG